MDTLIANLENGNNGDAKRQARRFTTWDIRERLMLDLGWSLNKSTLAADWLKGRDCWQDYCDAD